MHIRFGQLELDEQRFLLQRDGVRLRVRPKVFDLLVHLIRYRERVVLREELILALWGTTAVGLGSLSGLVNELRQVLGEAGRGPSSIRTVHARGYQFVAAVEPREDARMVRPGADALADVDEARDATLVARNAHFDSAMGPIRESFARVSRVGARAVLVESPSLSHRSRLLDHASASISSAGFEIHRLPLVPSDENHATALVGRLLGSLIERYGIDAIRSAIPVRAREIRDHLPSTVTSPKTPKTSNAPSASTARITRPRDPIAARQYDERVWRSAAELLGEFSRSRPVALVVDDLDLTGAAAAPVVSTFLHLLGNARVFILGTLSAIGIGEPMGIATGSEERITIVRLAPLDRCELDDGHESHEVVDLPTVLRDALEAHIRDGRISLESVASWLRAERDRTDQVSKTSSSPTSERRMRRVEPDTSLRRSRLGTS
jgi:DNA-binding winged helix-turn-helix (wHTH) protein